MGATITVTKTKIRRQDFSDVTSPVLRWHEVLPDVVIEGGICPTSATLVGTITAVTAIVEGRRVTVAETAKTFTANKDTYVDLSYTEAAAGTITGTWKYSEVANGAAQPSIAANAIRCFRAVTDSDSLNTVTDFRAINAGVGMGAPVGV